MSIVKILVMLVVFSALSSAARTGNDAQALAILVVVVAFWKVRLITEWLRDRRWRDNWRSW